MTNELDRTGAFESVDRVIADYLQAVERGQVPDRAALLRDHPDVADQLKSFFADYDRVGRNATAFRLPDPSATVTAGADGVASLPRVRYLGDFELLSEIARGGMGVVFKAKQVTLNRVVALKMILAGTYATPQAIARFRAEAEAAANLDHPNILPLYEVGEHEGHQYFSMKLVEGGSLAAKVGELKADPRATAAMTATLARAVDFAHRRGILHRDLKPANILLDADGTPYVTDFGLAKKVDTDDGATKTGAIMGTPSYMAPEQARGEKGLTTAVDVYSLGAILYELLTGRPPFREETVFGTVKRVLEDEPLDLRTLNPDADRDLSVIALKCLRKDPAGRYASAADLADDLDRRLRGEPIAARPTTTTQRAWMWAKRNRAVAGLGAGLAAALVLGTAGSLWNAEKSRQYAEDATKKSIEARANHQMALHMKEEALKSEQESHDALVRGTYAQARAVRLARQPGWRDESLALLRSARAAMGRGRNVPSNPPKDLPTAEELRGEAVMALIDRDVAPVRELAFNTQITTVVSANGSRMFQTGPIGSPPRNRAVVTDLKTGLEVASVDWGPGSVPEASNLVSARAINGDGTRALCQSGDSGPTQVRELPSGKLLLTLPDVPVDPTTPEKDRPKKYRPTWSADGRRAIAVRATKGRAELIVWDLQRLGPPRVVASLDYVGDAGGALVSELSKDSLFFGSLRMAADSTRVSFVTPDRKTLRILDVTTDPPKATEVVPGDEIVTAEWSPVAPVVALLVKASPTTQRVKFWDVAANTARESGDATYPVGNMARPSLLAFSPTGRWVALNPSAQTVHVLESRSGLEVARVPDVANADLTRVFWVSDDKFATYGLMEKPRVWKLSADPPVRTYERVIVKGRPAFGPDGKRFAAYSQRGSLAPDGSVFDETGAVVTLKGTPRNRVAVVNRETGAIELYLDAFDSPAFDDLLFSPDGTALAMRDPQTALVRDVATGKELLRTPLPRGTGGKVPTRLAFAADGTLFAIVDDVHDKKRRYALWDVRSGRPVAGSAPIPHSGTISEVVKVLPRGGRFLLPGPPLVESDDARGVTRLFDVPTGALRSESRLEKGGRDYLMTMAASPDGRLVTSISLSLDVVASGGEMMRNSSWVVHDLPTGRELLRVPNSTSAPSPCDVSTDNRTFAVGAARGHVELWDVPSKELLVRWQPYGGKPVVQLAFTPDGDLATADERGQLRVLNVRDLRSGLATLGLDWEPAPRTVD
jgi:WD40 repeat protein